MDAIDEVRRGLPEQYEIEHEVGRGGSAIVYRAVDRRHGRAVAIKVLTPDVWGASASDRFRREIRIVAQLRHPNILPLFDSGEVAGRPFFVMPYVVGEPLDRRLERQGPLPIDEAIDIVLDVADGLSYAHGRGIVHRDIKPANILLADGRAVIADFGIARAMDVSADTFNTSKGHAPGTPAYMSPEQAGAEEVDARSDIYSLGCVLYEALSGEPPFSGRTAQAVLARHLHQPPPSLTIVRPAVPAPVAETVDRTLQKVPADRFRSAEAFAAALREARTAKVSPFRGGRGRRLRWVAAAAVAVLALGWYLVGSFPSDDVALDDSRVVVYPFVQVGGSDSSQVGWDVALAAGTALEHTDPLRWIDGWLWLPEDVRRAPSGITPATAQRIAWARGAGRYITGIIRSMGDSTAVTVRLHRTADDEILGQETAHASATAPHVAGLNATVRLLPTLLEPGREVDLSPLADRAPAAVALTIQGDRAYRRSSFREAYEFYGRAVAEDSLIAIAAARGAASAIWEEEYEGGLELARLAVRQRDMLPQRYRHLVTGVEAYLTGSADTAVAYLERALAEEPGWAEAGTALGEVYHHLFPSGADPVADAARVFREVAERDSAFMPPLRHLIEITIREGSLRESRALIDRLARNLGLEAREVRRLEWMQSCVEEGVEQVPWTDLAAEDPSLLASLGRSFAAGGASPACAEQAFRALRGAGAAWSWGSLLGLESVLLAQGRTSQAVALLDTALAGGMTAVYPAYVFSAGISPDFEPGARAAEAVARRSFGELYRGANGINLWLLGIWFADRGEPDRTRAVADELRRYIDGPHAREARRLSEALDAHAALARGDRGEAIEGYSELAPDAPLWRLIWEFHEPLAPERIRLARALLMEGEYERALRAASVFDHPVPVTYVAYLAPSLAIRLRAAEALGRTDLVNTLRTRLTGLGWPAGEVPLSMTGPLLAPR